MLSGQRYTQTFLLILHYWQTDTQLNITNGGGGGGAPPTLLAPSYLIVVSPAWRTGTAMAVYKHRHGLELILQPDHVVVHGSIIHTVNVSLTEITKRHGQSFTWLNLLIVEKAHYLARKLSHKTCEGKKPKSESTTSVMITRTISFQESSCLANCWLLHVKYVHSLFKKHGWI